MYVSKNSIWQVKYFTLEKQTPVTNATWTDFSSEGSHDVSPCKVEDNDDVSPCKVKDSQS